jgi:hypothetical protein
MGLYLQPDLDDFFSGLKLGGFGLPSAPKNQEPAQVVFAIRDDLATQGDGP